MKRILCLAMALMMLFSLAGCVVEPTDESGHTLTYVEGKDVVINEQTYIGLFFDYTNDSGETVLPCDAINVKAFQNGIELVVTVFTGQETEGAIQCDTQVQTGITARVVWLFERVDDSPVSVETTDGQKFVVE